MFHEYSDDDVDEDELRHQDKDDEEERREIWRNAAVPETLIPLLALLPEGVLHDAVPVVAGGDAE